MGESIQKAIENITYSSKKFPEDAFRIISEEKEEAVPYLRAAIEKAVCEKDDLDEEYQLHFYALYLLGQFQERECFSQIMELASLPGEVLDYLIGDAITTGLSDILYNTYNGDLKLLKNAVKNPDIDEFARSGMLKVMGQLFLDGSLKKEEWQDFIRQIVYEEDEIGDYIYTELAYMICECHLVEMLPEIRRLYEDNRVDEFGIGEYDSCVDMMFRYDNTSICSTPIDAADMLRGWVMFQESPQSKFEEKDIKNLMRTMEAEYTQQSGKSKIGRNDPCPCGSGKKYKKCCLNKPKSPVDLIESDQEKQKWLEEYPVSAREREEGRIYLEDFFDSESIEIDKLIYLALKHRPYPIWRKEPDEVVENRTRVYLSEAFLKFAEKAEKENIKTLQAYNDKYAIHYQCEEWLESLLMLLKKSGDKAFHKTVSACYKKMSG